MEKIKGFFKNIGLFVAPIVCDRDSKDRLKLSLGRLFTIANVVIYFNLVSKGVKVPTEVLGVLAGAFTNVALHKFSKK